jgi:drug/metabolite transporter (DMT)-like permease
MSDQTSKDFWFHLLAILTVVVWGTTFINTKVLINDGLTPSTILFLRFLIAYLCIWPFTYKRLFARSIHDELLFLVAGMSGGSIYFLAENTALSLSLASNVSLIVCTAPILTALLFFFLRKGETMKISLLYGSIVAFSGVAIVIYSGGAILRINPLGDFLALAAAFLWAIYGLVTKGLNIRYPSMFVTRKVFFYGILTILPVVLTQTSHPGFDLLIRPDITAHLLFLGVVASMLCFFSWNIVTRRLGVVRVTNYIYFAPVITLLTAAIFLGEQLPGLAFLGAFFILAGVYSAEKR